MRPRNVSPSHSDRTVVCSLTCGKQLPFTSALGLLSPCPEAASLPLVPVYTVGVREGVRGPAPPFVPVSAWEFRSGG